MLPVAMAVTAVLFYAFQNVVIEQKLANYDTFGVLMYFYLAMFPMALLGRFLKKMAGFPVPLPEGNMIILVLLLGVAYFLADACLFGAYTIGGDVVTISTIATLFPVAASAMKYFWTGELPNPYQMIGYALAFLAVVFVAKGSV